MMDLKNYKLYAYGNICLKADIEESIGDMAECDEDYYDQYYGEEE